MTTFSSVVIAGARRVALVIALVIMSTLPNFAARSVPEFIPKSTARELVVFESRASCLICAVFRRDVGTPYKKSTHQKLLPLRYIDLAGKRGDERRKPHPGLAAPLTVLPTAVILRDGREVARVEGYTGPKLFLQALRAARRR
ncbi:MAG: hypothetical protein AAGG99_07085 [Pseudomonadota bacterium]